MHTTCSIKLATQVPYKMQSTWFDSENKSYAMQKRLEHQHFVVGSMPSKVPTNILFRKQFVIVTGWIWLDPVLTPCSSQIPFCTGSGLNIIIGCAMAASSTTVLIIWQYGGGCGGLQWQFVLVKCGATKCRLHFMDVDSTSSTFEYIYIYIFHIKYHYKQNANDILCWMLQLTQYNYKILQDAYEDLT